MRDHFRSDQRIGKVAVPLLIMHGARDPGISIQFGERLYELANQPKRFVRFPDGGHDDLDAHRAVEIALKFVYETGAP